MNNLAVKSEFRVFDIGNILLIGDVLPESGLPEGRVCIVVPGFGVRVFSVENNIPTKAMQIDADACVTISLPEKRQKLLLPNFQALNPLFLGTNYYETQFKTLKEKAAGQLNLRKFVQFSNEMGICEKASSCDWNADCWFKSEAQDDFILQGECDPESGAWKGR